MPLQVVKMGDYSPIVDDIISPALNAITRHMMPCIAAESDEASVIDDTNHSKHAIINGSFYSVSKLANAFFIEDDAKNSSINPSMSNSLIIS